MSAAPRTSSSESGASKAASRRSASDTTVSESSPSDSSVVVPSSAAGRAPRVSASTSATASPTAGSVTVDDALGPAGAFAGGAGAASSGTLSAWANHSCTGARRTLSVCVRGKSSSGQRRHMLVRWCGARVALADLMARARSSSVASGAAGTTAAASFPGVGSTTTAARIAPVATSALSTSSG